MNPQSNTWRIEEANRRLAVLQDVAAHMAEHNCSERKACKKLRIDQATLGRWKKRFEKEGFNGLLPDTDDCGRKSTIEKLGITPETLDKIQGINLDVQSTTAANRLFAHSDQCPEELARLILDPNKCSKHALPPSLRQATRLSEPVINAHRGRRQLDLKGICIPRKVDILPGDIFVSDDTTPIWGWWVPWYESKEYPFGVKLLQGQFLPVMDVASQAVICYALIAREKSSYRAADIWALFGHVFDTIGLPRLGFQLERGSWESNMVRGEEVEYQEGEVTMSRRVGGLRQLPTNVTPWHHEKAADAASVFPKTLQTWTSYLPKSKSIEAFFNRSQTLEGTLYGALGRDQMRQPYEKTKKLFQACQRGAEDPRNHFLSHTEMVTRINGLLQYLNFEPMEGEVFHGIPQMKFEQALRDYPLYRMPDDQRWLYKRDWKKLPITSGWARVRLTDELSSVRYSLFYSRPEIFGQIEGAEVFVYYDRQNFEQPAQIIAGQPVAINGQRVSPGEFICEAQYFDRKGSFLDGDTTGHDVKKLWRNAVLTTYGSIVTHAPSRQVPAEIEARRAVSGAQSIALPVSNSARPEGPVQQDGRPTAAPLHGARPAGLSPETIERRKNLLARQAQIARRAMQETQ